MLRSVDSSGKNSLHSLEPRTVVCYDRSGGARDIATHKIPTPPSGPIQHSTPLGTLSLHAELQSQQATQGKDRSSHRDRPHVVLDRYSTGYWTADRTSTRLHCMADTTNEWDRKDDASTRGSSSPSNSANSNRSRSTRGRTRSQRRIQEQTVNQLLDQDLDQWDQWVRIS